MQDTFLEGDEKQASGLDVEEVQGMIANDDQEMIEGSDQKETDEAKDQEIMIEGVKK